MALLFQMPKFGGQEKRQAEDFNPIKEEVKRAKVAKDKGAKGDGKGKKGNGKDKRAGKKQRTGKGSVPLPKALLALGCQSHVNGKQPCFSFNLGVCKTTGSSCDKGFHLCMKQGCGGAHPALGCTA